MVGVQDLPVAPRPTRLRLSPTEAVMDLTHFIFFEEKSAKRGSFLSMVTAAAAKHGILGSTLSGSGNGARLTRQLLSGADESNDPRSSYEATCHEWIHALRERST